LPVAGRFALEDLGEAIRAHADATPGLMTIAWVLMGGVNHDRQEAEALADLLGTVPLRISLIDVNDARPDGYRRATDEERRVFFDQLSPLGPLVRRYSGGRNQHAACGMLAAKRRGRSSSISSISSNRRN
jgi:23S rRNA (adenine2503-C2)-methyltransferase